MKDDFEINGPSLLAIGRQGYGLGSGECECQASSSSLPVPDCSGSNISAKKSRMDDGVSWHRENDTWRSLSGEFSQPQALPDSQRIDQQHSIGSSQGYWDFTFCNVNNLDEPGSGLGSTSMDSDTNLGKSSKQGIFGYCEEKEPGLGNTGFDFLQAGADVAGSSSSSGFLSSWRAGNGFGEVNYSTEGASMRDKGRSWNGVESHQVGTVACSTGGATADGKGTANLMLNFLVQSPESITGKEFTMNHHNREGLNEKVEDRSCASQAENMYLRAGGGSQSSVERSNCSHSWIFSEDEAGKAPFQGGNLTSSLADHTGSVRPGHVICGRRRSSKRKISTFGLADASSFRAQGCSKREYSTRIGRETGPSRQDSKALGGSAIPGECVSTSASSMLQIGEDHGNGRTGFMGSEGDFFESLRGSSGEVSILDGTRGSTQSIDFAQFVGMQHEQSHSQLHSLFARNLRRSMPTAQSQAFSRRVSSNVQLGDLSRNSASNTGPLHESDQGPLAFGQRSSTSTAAASWPGNSSLLRGSVMLPTSGAPVRESTSNMFERSRIRTMSGRAAATLESRLAHQASTSRGVTVSTSRALNPSEATVQSSQLANSIFYPSGASSSHLSMLLSNRHHSRDVGRSMPPPLAPTTTSHPASFATSLEPPAGMHVGPSCSVTRPSLFLDGQAENLVAAPVQSIFGMPFCGLRMLPAGGERRQRFVSEILSALEHARRSAELSFEELVMLDPSLVYGDIHDEHSDMRLDVDNMSYEELLALEERIGNVSTGLSDESISKCLRETKYSSLDATVAALSQDCDMKCCICQEEYMEEDELGIVDCGHGYHTVCIKQWLLQKNWCPVCKAPAYLKS